MSESRVLVVGATGQLGGVIARKLLAGHRSARSRATGSLASLRAGAEIAPVDLRDLPKLTEACRGVEQIVATANNNMGEGPTSPTRIDLAGYQNLCAAARNTGVRRLVYVSYSGVSQDAPVDIFRIKWYIEDAIRRSGVPHVMLRPTAFMDIWIDQILAKGIREKGVATIFGDGNGVDQLHRRRRCRRVRREDPGAPRSRERGGRRRRAVEYVAERPGDAGRAPPEVVGQTPAHAGRGDALAAADRPAVQRGRRQADDAGPLRRDAVGAVSWMEDIGGSVWRRAANGRDLHRSDDAGSSRQRNATSGELARRRSRSHRAPAKV